MNEGVNDLMNERMKNMKRIIMIIMAAALVALPTMAQGFRTQATDDKVQTQAFQSTSTMTPVGSAYSANPSLNADGTAYNPATSSGPRKAKTEDPLLPPNPDIQEGDTGNTPLGDAVLPLMLMALAFGGVIYLRRRKALNR